MQITRLTIGGLSQEQISRELQVSEGTVNAIIQQLTISDETLRLQHEIAIVCKKSGIDIKQLASNLAFANAILKLGLKNNKIYSILRAIDSVFSEDASLSPEAVASLVLQICNLIVKNNTPLDNLYDEIKAKYSELFFTNKEISVAKKSVAELQNEKKKALGQYNLTLKELNNFTKLREYFEEVGLDFENREEIQNVLCDIREMDKDAKRIIDEVKKIRLLKITKTEIEQQCERLKKVLEIYQKKKQELKRDRNFLYPAIDVMNKLLQSGINPIVISNVFDVISKHQHYLSINDLANDIDTYGGIVGAIFKKKTELKTLNMDTQTFDATRDVMR